MKAKPKEMKPVRAWAVVDERGRMFTVARRRKDAEMWEGHGDRIARVEVREVSRRKGEAK